MPLPPEPAHQPEDPGDEGHDHGDLDDLEDDPHDAAQDHEGDDHPHDGDDDHGEGVGARHGRIASSGTYLFPHVSSRSQCYVPAMAADTSLRERRRALLARTDLQGDAFCVAYAAEADDWLSGVATRAV